VSQRAAIGTLLAALSPTARLTLVAADWAVSTLADDVAPEEARRALAKLDGIVSAGALHLERALGDAAARAHKGAGAAVLFVGCGVDGFGGDALRAPLAALRDGGIRLSIVATGEVPPPLADAAALTGGEAVSASALEGDLGALVDALKPRPARPVGAARGTEDWRPLETITGQTVWVGRAREVPSPLDGASEAVASADPADLLPLWDRARIVGAEGGGSAGADRTVPSALTPLRSLLVLETEADYARYGLAAPERIAGLRQVGDEGKMGKRLVKEQAKNAGILGVLQQTEGSRPATGFTAEAPAENSGNGVRGGLIGNTISGEGTIGVGNLDTIGKSGGGHGSDYGRGVGGLGGRRARAPDVVPGTASVRGALDKEIVRRIIRRHINEVRYCYEAELLRRPTLGGRVLVQFTVAASGQVVASGLQNSTLGNHQVDRCIVEAVRRWDFPRPLDGSIVIVSYPFVLTPAGITADTTSPFSVSPAPDRTAMDALALLAGRGELGDRVARIASLLGLDRTSDPESLAWMIDRQSASLSEITLVARLLVAAKRDRDAVRVLSESAQAEPAKIAAELRHMNAAAAATEVLALAKRGR
jgi:TonB family protein